MNTLVRRTLVAGAFLTTVSLAPRAQAQVVISQVYGGGGSSATSPVPSFKEDYVELFNTGTAAVDLTGFSLQYASAAGLFPTTGSNLFVFSTTAGSTTIAAGGYFLVRFGSPSTFTGVDLTNYDALGSAALSGTSGKIVLAGDANQVTASASATLTPTVFSGNVIDFVGYGTANAYESNAATAGLGGVPVLSTTTAAIRNSVAGVFTDTNNNKLDFTVGTPTPHYSGGLASPPVAAPEPSGVVALLIGAGALGLMVARRRTQRAGQCATG